MTAQRLDGLIRVLRTHPRLGSADLCARLGGIHRSTLGRALNTLGDSVISCGEARRTRYALRRELRGNATALPLYRIDERGKGLELGQLSLTYPGGTTLSYAAPFPWPLDKEMAEGWFAGLPYPIVDMRQQGFLGRNFARHHALDLGVMTNPDDWSDEDIAYVLSKTGYDQPGDLILGDVAYRRFLESRDGVLERFLSSEQLPAAYLRLAEEALLQGDAGSSAGGEFPKFTTGRTLDGKLKHVIVKFSGADKSSAVRRWSDLLVCEHLASLALRECLALPAAESAIHSFAGRTFLEVVRFDRHGDSGRSAVCTLASLNAALVGTAGAPWPKTARALQMAGWLAEVDVTKVDLVWAFGKHIGNNDMHEGNLAFRPGLTLAPVYDMLPMMYAPMRGGEIPDKQFAPGMPLPAELSVWTQAAKAGIYFWRTCAEDKRISTGFRRICGENGKILSSLLAAQT